MLQEIREQLVDSFRNDDRVTKMWSEVESSVRAGRRSPTTGARQLLAAHGVEAKVIAWTVDELDRMRQLAALGVDGICTNDPRLFG
jgi:glycerophosphoryl diester phosphodiesterase